MMSRPLQYTLSQLQQVLDDHHLVAVGPTAACAHDLTVVDQTDQLHFATRNPADPETATALRDQLADRLQDVQQVLATATTGWPAGPIETSQTSDHLTVTIPDGRDGPDAAAGPGLVTVNVTLDDPGLQPIDNLLRLACSTGGPSIPVTSALDVHRHNVNRWLRQPHDPAAAADLGLTVNRAGAPTAATVVCTRLGARNPGQLATLLAADTPTRVAAAGIPDRLRPQLEDGLAQLSETLTRAHTATRRTPR